jgi:hypothetical protein
MFAAMAYFTLDLFLNPDNEFSGRDWQRIKLERLAENPAVSEQTIMALAGHVSKSMLARYSQIRQAAKQAAIDALEAGRTAAKSANFDAGSPQNPPQLIIAAVNPRFAIPKKSLN